MFFLFILIILLFSFLAIHTSRLEIEIKNLDIDTQREKDEKINKNFKITLYILIFKHIKIFKKNLRKKIKEQEKVKIENNIKTDYKEMLKNIKIEISKLDFDLIIGTKDAAQTALIVGIVAGMVGNIVKKPQYSIKPVYVDKNILKLKLDCIIKINLINYIYSLIKKKRRMIKNERTSNRKSYDYSYE